MRMLGKLGIAATMFALAVMMPARAEAVLILTPANNDGTADFSPPNNCEPGCVESNFGLLAGSIDLLFKAPEDGDGGSFEDSYTATFNGDNSGGSITFNLGEPSISCPACYLAVKDGNHDPVYYFYNLSGWNGVEEISLSGFWPNGGEISHVSIWGGEGDGGDGDGGGDTIQVAEPASLLLLGLGALLGGRRARRQFAVR